MGKEYVKAVYSHPAYLTSMQSASCKMSGWKAQAGKKIAGRNINNLRYADDTTLVAESEEELKSLFMMVKEDSEKAGLKVNFFTLLFDFHQRPFSSSSLSAIKVVSSEYLRLLIFLPAILIPACASSSMAFFMIYSEYKLNKQGDNTLP